MPRALFANAWAQAAAAALCLGLASPPGAFSYAGWLVLPGLALLYRVVRGAHRPALIAFVAGCAYMAMFSWSVRHVLFAGYAAIVLLGGCYFAILPRWVVGLVALRVPAPLAFGVAIAGANWLRAHMPEIWYPHGQPAHALYHWPAFLRGPASLGGEELLNLLLAAGAAAAVEVCMRAHRRTGLIILASIAALWVVADLTYRRPVATAADPTLDIAAIQPGLTIDDLFLRETDALGARQLTTLVQPTLAAAGEGVAEPADLVLWPESTAHVELLVDTDAHAQLVTARWWCAEPRLRLAAKSKLLLGGHMFTPTQEGTAVALLLDHRGRYLAHHEKLRLVPGGERQPFLGWLPEAWSVALREGMARAIGAAPHLAAGELRPPMEVGNGVRVGALLCYDNAFPEVARQYVAAGANLLVVLSNEVWYRRGAELDQMTAMTVLRALETGCPIVRATVDGSTLAVNAEGAILDRVSTGDTGVLRIRLAVPARAGSVAPAAPAVAFLCALSLAFAIAQGLWAWARLRRP